MSTLRARVDSLEAAALGLARMMFMYSPDQERGYGGKFGSGTGPADGGSADALQAGSLAEVALHDGSAVHGTVVSVDPAGNMVMQTLGGNITVPANTISGVTITKPPVSSKGNAPPKGAKGGGGGKGKAAPKPKKGGGGGKGKAAPKGPASPIAKVQQDDAVTVHLRDGTAVAGQVVSLDPETNTMVVKTGAGEVTVDGSKVAHVAIGTLPTPAKTPTSSAKAPAKGGKTPVAAKSLASISQS